MIYPKKYGLQLRDPQSQQKKQPGRPPLPTPHCFDDNNYDTVERDIFVKLLKINLLKMSQRRPTLVTSTSTLEKNVVFGGVADSGKPKEEQEETVILSREAPENVSPVANTTSSESSEENFGIGFAKPVYDASTQDQAAVNPSPTDQPGPNHHKRSEDAVAAAKERFLAWKKAKEQ